MIVGYCEYGYRMYMWSDGKVERLPFPFTSFEYSSGYVYIG